MLSLVGLVRDEIASQRGVGRQRVSCNEIAKRITILMGAEGPRCHTTQILRVEQHGHGLPLDIKEKLRAHFSTQDRSVDPKNIRLLEHYFAVEPANKLWWATLRNTVSQKVFEAVGVHGGWFAVSNTNALLVPTQDKYDIDGHKCMHMIQTAELALKTYAREPGTETSITRTEYHSDSLEYLRKPSHTLAVSWQPDPKFFDGSDKLQRAILQMKLAICYSDIYFVDASDGAKSGEQRVQEAAAAIMGSIGEIHALVDAALFNWIALHREHPTFMGVYTKVMETLESPNRGWARVFGVPW